MTCTRSSPAASAPSCLPGGFLGEPRYPGVRRVAGSPGSKGALARASYSSASGELALRSRGPRSGSWRRADVRLSAFRVAVTPLSAARTPPRGRAARRPTGEPGERSARSACHRRRQPARRRFPARPPISAPPANARRPAGPARSMSGKSIEGLRSPAGGPSRARTSGHNWEISGSEIKAVRPCSPWSTQKSRPTPIRRPDRRCPATTTVTGAACSARSTRMPTQVAVAAAWSRSDRSRARLAAAMPAR